MLEWDDFISESFLSSDAMRSYDEAELMGSTTERRRCAAHLRACLERTIAAARALCVKLNSATPPDERERALDALPHWEERRAHDFAHIMYCPEKIA